MLTNEKIAAIHANVVAHGFWEPGSEPTFGEYCAFIHEEISEAFSAWRNNEPDEYVVDGKPEGVWVELADVVIRCADAIAAWNLKVHKKELLQVPSFYIHMGFAEFISYLHWRIADAHMCGISRILGDRIMDTVNIIYSRADHTGIDLDAVIDRKCAYNATRPYKHGKRM
jgi:NTP pyrophosphatase (non-canonical NTP hydrolase)